MWNAGSSLQTSSRREKVGHRVTVTWSQTCMTVQNIVCEYRNSFFHINIANFGNVDVNLIEQHKVLNVRVRHKYPFTKTTSTTPSLPYNTSFKRRIFSFCTPKATSKPLYTNSRTRICPWDGRKGSQKSLLFVRSVSGQVYETPSDLFIGSLRVWNDVEQISLLYEYYMILRQFSRWQCNSGLSHPAPKRTDYQVVPQDENQFSYHQECENSGEHQKVGHVENAP